MKFFTALFTAFCFVAISRADKVDDYIKSEMKKREIPGLALMIVKNERPAKIGAYGFANLEHNVPVTKDTVFEIGSVTKQFTAAGIMLLVQDVKLSVDDKISQHLKNTPASWSNITVRHLLTHTSGIKSYTGIDKGFEYTEHLTQDEFIKLIGAYPLEFQPGDSWKYCNSGYNLLGFIIENTSGKKYWEFMSQRIFQPVDMNATTNRNPSIIVRHRADGYEKNRSGNLMNRDYDLTDVFSAGEIISTVGDLAKWDAALNSEKILTSASKQAMWTPTKLNNGTVKNYGFGWYVDELNGHKNIGHSGSTSGFSASFQRFPDDKTAIIVLCNSGESGVATALAKEVAKIRFGK
jgi:CubicO group peptidase (beta-lactamase class C family)